MKEILLAYVRDLYTDKNALPIYDELAKIFEKNEMFNEVGACLEKIWHITQNHNLYKEMGDIFFNKVRNHNIAFAAYNKYLQYTQPEFYKNYANNLCKLGYEAFKFELDDEDYSRELINLCDRYHAIVYIMILLIKNEEYDTVIDVANYLSKLKDKINKLNITDANDEATLSELSDSDNHLSDILSNVSHHNDINRLAITLNPSNEQAYLNIVEDYIIYNKKDEALNFYNNDYAIQFCKTKQNEYDKLCWAVSDYYRDRYEFYKAVLFQKYALEATDISEV